MRTIERLALYVLVLLGGLSLLDRADAEEGSASDADGTVRTTRIEVTDAEGRVVLRLAAGAGGGGEITVLNRQGKTAARLYARPGRRGVAP